ncbi:MAG: hypothetical protein FWD91_00885 [Treponema sp.]|nr:hypothetical protein [Treponema sp.]
MIKSWPDFLIAVERMRECQKEYVLRSGIARFQAAKKSEEVVDEVIKQKRAEWAKKEQPELTGGKQ